MRHGDLSTTFKAVSEPTRRRILELLADGEHTVSELHAHFEMSQPAISQHLKVLLDAGLVEPVREGRTRVYRLLAEPLREVHDWAAHYERFWTQKLDALGKYLDHQEKNR